MITAKTFYDAFSDTGIHCRHVELSDIVEIDGHRGYVAALGRKYIQVRVYGGKLIKLNPLANSIVWTGEQHY